MSSLIHVDVKFPTRYTRLDSFSLATSDKKNKSFMAECLTSPSQKSNICKEFLQKYSSKKLLDNICYIHKKYL